MKSNTNDILQNLNTLANKIVDGMSYESLPEINSVITDFYNFDSLEFMEFISAIEEEFDIEFPEDVTFDELNSIPKLLNIIQNKTCNR